MQPIHLLLTQVEVALLLAKDLYRILTAGIGRRITVSGPGGPQTEQQYMMHGNVASICISNNRLETKSTLICIHVQLYPIVIYTC